MSGQRSPRTAGAHDALVAARLLHDFNTEFETPSPGVDVLQSRLVRLLSGDRTVAVLAGEPAVGIALVTLRANVWYDGEVALLDELYVVPPLRGRGIGSALVGHVVEVCRERGVELVEINVDEPDVDALRFYERHGFTSIEPDTGARALYLHRELGET